MKYNTHSHREETRFKTKTLAKTFPFIIVNVLLLCKLELKQSVVYETCCDVLQSYDYKT